jgi:hypothetical protein
MSKELAILMPITIDSYRLTVIGRSQEGAANSGYRNTENSWTGDG